MACRVSTTSLVDDNDDAARMVRVALFLHFCLQFFSGTLKGTVMIKAAYGQRDQNQCLRCSFHGPR